MYRLHRQSVLPRVEVRRTGDWTLLWAVRTSASELRELALYGLALLMFIVAAFSSHGDAATRVGGAVNGGGLLLLLLGALTRILRRRRLFRGALLVHPWPIRLGDHVQLRFRAMLKKSVTVSSLTAKLECAEHVIIGYGRNERRRSAVIHEIDLPCSKRERQIVEEEWTFTVPAALPPSLDVRDSRIEWRVVAALTSRGVAIPADFVLLVIPEVVQ